MMRNKILTPEIKDYIVKGLKEGRRPRDIADDLGIKRQAMGSYCRDFKHLTYKKLDTEYFNVDLYLKKTYTI